MIRQRKTVTVALVVELPLLIGRIPNEILAGLVQSYLAGRLPATLGESLGGGAVPVPDTLTVSVGDIPA